MKSLKTMSYNELYSNFNLLFDLKYLNRIILDDKVCSELQRLIQTNTLGKHMALELIKSFMGKNEKYVDKEAYVFYTLKGIKDFGTEFKYADISKKCKQYLENSKIVCFEPNISTSFEDDDEIICTTARDLIGSKLSPKEEIEGKELLKEISQEINLEQLFTANSNIEIRQMFGKDPYLNSLIVKLNFINVISRAANLSLKEKRFLLSNTPEAYNKLNELLEENKSKIKEMDEVLFFENTVKYLKKYPQYFDIDAILLIAACRAHEYLENTDLNDEEVQMFTKILQIANDKIKNHDKKVKGINSGIAGGGVIEYSYKKLCEDTKRITENGDYLRKIEEEYLIDLLTSEEEVCELDADKLKLIRFSSDEYSKMMKKEGVLYFFIENDLIDDDILNEILKVPDISQSDILELIKDGLIDKSHIDLYLHNYQKISDEMFYVLDNANMLTGEEKLDYYMQGKVSINVIDGLLDESKEEIGEILSNYILMKLYKDEEKKEEYLRYATIFRDLKLVNKKKEIKNNIGDELISLLGESFEENDLIELYKQHLITIENVKDWGGDSLILNMMKEAMLRPVDVKDICSDGNYNCILEIMKDPSISKKNKLAIFYTTFSQCGENFAEKEMENRENCKKECLQYINFSDKISSETNKGESTRKKTGEPRRRNEFITDPLIRWNLIGLLDTEYSYDVLDQGMMVFKLPNLNGGIIILEKMFRKDKINYGRATKIIAMPIEEFDEIKDELVVNGDIPVKVVESHPKIKGRLTSLDHIASWGQNLADLFNYETDRRRTQENISMIDTEIQRVMNSRSIRK